MAAPNKQVFINCPLDHDFYPLLEAITFSICVCGYKPRFASERVESGRSRLARIVSLIDECDFSLHDISRTELSPNLPRFNMSFELGLALGRKYSIALGGADGVLILDREPFRYHECFSDISGCDPLAHDDQPGIAMHRIWKWLVSHDKDQGATSDRRSPEYGPVMLKPWLEQFQEEMRDAKVRIGGKWDDLPLSELVFSIRVWIEARTKPLN
jgi:hypothetical protein